MAKRERKPIKAGGHFGLDKNGNYVPINPKEIPAFVNQCEAAAKTIETGQLYRVALKGETA